MKGCTVPALRLRCKAAQISIEARFISALVAQNEISCLDVCKLSQAVVKAKQQKIGQKAKQTSRDKAKAKQRARREAVSLP